LKGEKLLPVIKRIRAGKPEGLQEFGRLQVPIVQLVVKLTIWLYLTLD
jgi:hypothetical protein